MKIIIDGEELKFELENEKYLSEVLDAINDWLFPAGRVIQEIKINNKIFNGEIEELSDYPIEKVKELKLTTISINRLVQNSLLELKKYLITLYQMIDMKNKFSEKDIKFLTKGLSWMKNILLRANKLYKYEDEKDELEYDFLAEIESIDNLASLINKLLEEKQTSKLKDIIKNEYKQIINAWISRIDKLISLSSSMPRVIEATRKKVAAQIANLITRIPDMLKLIEGTIVLLRTGEESEAMQNIKVMVDTMQSVIELLQTVQTTFSIDFKSMYVQEKSVEEINQDLLGILRELLEAMESHDTVLISDLLEYELPERLRNYIEVLQTIAREINLELQ